MTLQSAAVQVVNGFLLGSGLILASMIFKVFGASFC
jgi:hypothetical protein